MRKATPFEGSARIPFIIRPPMDRGFKKGSKNIVPVTHMDVMPTLLELAGTEIPDMVEGRSLTGLMKGSNTGWREYIHGEHANGNHGWQYLTDGREKYIWETASGKELFFSLADDPQETRDLSSDAGYVEKVTLWRDRLIDLLAARPQNGLVAGRKLIAGKVLPNVRPELL